MSIIVFITENPLCFVFISLLVGLLVGSFLNVVIYRLPIMMMNSWRREAKEILEIAEETTSQTTFNLFLPASSCPNCGHKITALENIPIISYCCLKGRCRECHNPISKRYPLIELLTAILSGWLAWYYTATPQALLIILLSWGLIAISMIDIDYQIIPDTIVLPLLWIGLLTSLYNLLPNTSIKSSILGAVTGYMILWIVNALFKLIRGYDGMGNGDFKLLAMFGAWGGYQILPIVILFSALAGTSIGIISICLFKGKNKFPFGPYLAIAGWIALIWGQVIIANYLKFSGIQ